MNCTVLNGEEDLDTVLCYKPQRVKMHCHVLGTGMLDLEDIDDGK